MEQFVNIEHTTIRENLCRLTNELNEVGFDVHYLTAPVGIYRGLTVMAMQHRFTDWAEIVPHFEDRYSGHTILLYELRHVDNAIVLRFAWV